MNTLYLGAANLHLHLATFFDSSTVSSYSLNLLGLYVAATTFLNHLLLYETSTNSSGDLLPYATNYILQMTVAAGFTLYKLLNSFFAAHVKLEEGRDLFHKTIWAIRRISVVSNDLPARLAEVLAQLWRGGGAGAGKHGAVFGGKEDGSLRLKVRCRMSMSLVFDSVWRWREEFQANGQGNLDSAVTNPTNPDSTVDSPPSVTSGSNATTQTPQPSSNHLPTTSSSPFDPLGLGLGPQHSPNYEVFDPLNWMLDGLVDFPSSLGNPSMPEMV